MRMRRVIGPIVDSVEIKRVVHCEVHAGSAGERPFACRMGVGCVGGGSTLDEAKYADGKLVANESC